MFAQGKSFEHHTQPLLPAKLFWWRMFNYAVYALVLISFALGLGVLGYRFFEKLSWLDALLNASMILGGMGPVNELHTDGGKLFASFYALFSGIAFLAIAGTLVAPIAHRFLHRLHIELGEDSSTGSD
jgi:hypothetical protein